MIIGRYLLIDDCLCDSKTTQKRQRRKQPFDCPVFAWESQYYTDAHVLLFTSDCLWCKLHVSGRLFLEQRILSKHEALTVPHADLMLGQILKRWTNINPPSGKVLCLFDCIGLPYKF